MLLSGVNHVAIVTKNADRLVAFYREVFEAEVAGRQERANRGALPILLPLALTTVLDSGGRGRNQRQAEQGIKTCVDC